MSNTADIANIIRQQIGAGVFMSLGARNLRHGSIAALPDAEALPSLTFEATILPMTKSGQRASAARTMRVTVGLNASDYYDIAVTYPQRGDRYGLKDPVIHLSLQDVDCEQLARTLLALDYNGEEVLNPRYV
ncbi:hypothetical protein SEA_GRETCHEN_70 [Microbacterium phage Gretchen]|uniref:Uncharacterized protein n=1 Tax=Microbacterium phage Percival TaxID=2201439 RepID=A0A2Z4Q6N8_9CAUD|nr:hypothetical protein PBI_PERCIVAL_71 [Microbacterium phage Percival]UDL14844.1 hypothetical protein SEA_GRETCHEN_70 [Microbacterium phage Gretchen]